MKRIWFLTSYILLSNSAMAVGFNPCPRPHKAYLQCELEKNRGRQNFEILRGQQLTISDLEEGTSTTVSVDDQNLSIVIEANGRTTGTFERIDVPGYYWGRSSWAASTVPALTVKERNNYYRLSCVPKEEMLECQ